MKEINQSILLTTKLKKSIHTILLFDRKIRIILQRSKNVYGSIAYAYISIFCFLKVFLEFIVEK